MTDVVDVVLHEGSSDSRQAIKQLTRPLRPTHDSAMCTSYRIFLGSYGPISI